MLSKSLSLSESLLHQVRILTPALQGASRRPNDGQIRREQLPTHYLGTHGAWRTGRVQAIMLMANSYVSFAVVLDQVVDVGYFALQQAYGAAPFLSPFCL